MKKTLLALIIAFAMGTFANAQDTIKVVNAPPPRPASSGADAEIRLNVYGAYVFDDSFNSTYDNKNYYNGTIEGGFHYGAGIEFMIKENYGVELLWMGQNTTAPTNYRTTTDLFEKHTNFDVSMNYAMLGFGRHIHKPGGKVEAYTGLMLGALFVNAKNPDNGNSGNATKFSWGARMGLNVWATDKIAIKLQAQLLSAVQSVGGSLYFGTGGAGAGLSGYSTMLQFGLGGGLSFALGK